MDQRSHNSTPSDTDTGQYYPVAADAPHLAGSDSRLVLKSNWFMLFTRRKRPSTSSEAASSASCSASGEGAASADQMPKTPDEYPGGRHRKHSIMYAFNKCLKFGSRRASRSVSFPVNLGGNDERTEQDPAIGVIVDTSPVRSEPADEHVVPPRQPNVSINPSEPDSTATWLNGLSAEEAKIYREKIAMNPHGWYRGGMSRDIAQKKLQGQPNGSFLVRDSQTSGCNFTLSFRSAGITLHYRIENTDGLW